MTFRDLQHGMRLPYTAVAVAAMVLGNLAGCSASGARAEGVHRTVTAPAARARPRHLVQTSYHVPGKGYQICTNRAAKYLTSPYTYRGRAGHYSVRRYESLLHRGARLPPLPAYLASEPASARAVTIYKPGSDVNVPGYDLPLRPELFFFEGGSYGTLGFGALSGDEFVGGSAPGYPEPVFNDGDQAAGISAQNDTYAYEGGTGTLSAAAVTGANQLHVSSAAGLGHGSRVNFPDGTHYAVQAVSGTTVTLQSALSRSESATANPYWYSEYVPPLARASAAAAQGATTLSLGSSIAPVLPWEQVVVGTTSYQVRSVSGDQSGYTLSLAGPLDSSVTASTPVYYDNLAGDVTVDYLDITHDTHNTTGTIYTGSGWTIEHDDIHDGYGNAVGVGVYGGNEGTIEYNCFARMGVYAVNLFGTDDDFSHNEVYASNYRPDPGCGCSGGGKWWGTLNADIVDNSFVDGPYGAQVWFDNGNTGALVEGNYFYHDADTSVANETGYNAQYLDNLFLDDGWGDGQGQPSNTAGAIELNSSGGMEIPGSRYEDQV
ncbi:MAG: right-handed parallel beta-helix repeat-containing protein, partial [Acidimicrobiales bacterium]